MSGSTCVIMSSAPVAQACMFKQSWLRWGNNGPASAKVASQHGEEMTEAKPQISDLALAYIITAIDATLKAKVCSLCYLCQV